MDSPEKIGIEKLSLMLVNDNSVIVAMSAPIIIVAPTRYKLLYYYSSFQLRYFRHLF